MVVGTYVDAKSSAVAFGIVAKNGSPPPVN